MEAFNYPFYGVQYHPERNAFEWDLPEKLDHSADAVAAMQYLGKFFVNEARQSSHKFDSIQDETKALIYNYSPLFTGIIETDDYPEQQTYVFQF